jgi:hypothetical protein
MIFFCGDLVGGGEVAHAVNPAGSSCVGGGEAAVKHTHARELSWLRHYLLGDKRASTGPTIEYQTQDGSWHTARSLPKKAVIARGIGRLVNTVAPTNGVALAASPSAEGLRIQIARGPAVALGIPRVTGTVAGVGPDAALFFKILDVDAAGNAIAADDQVMPLRFYNLEQSFPARFSVDLAGVAWALPAGHTMVLEIVTTSNDHASSRIPAVMDVSVSVKVPVL